LACFTVQAVAADLWTLSALVANTLVTVDTIKYAIIVLLVIAIIAVSKFTIRAFNCGDTSVAMGVPTDVTLKHKIAFVAV